MKSMITACLSCVCIFLPLLGPACAADPAVPNQQLWMERDGAMRFDDLNRFLLGVHKGELPAPELKEALDPLLPGNGPWTAEQFSGAFAKIKDKDTRTIFFEPLSSDADIKKKSEQFEKEMNDNKTKPNAAVKGRIYIMQNMDGSAILPEEKDYVYLIPADPALWSKIKAADTNAAEEQYRKRVIDRLRELVKEGKAEIEPTIKILESGGLPAFSDPGWDVSQQIKKQLRLEGAYDASNDYQLVQEYLQKGPLASFVKKAHPDKKGAFQFQDVTPGLYFLYYRQDLITFFYGVQLAPGADVCLDVFRPFSTRTFEVQG